MNVIFPWLFEMPTRLVAMATRASVDESGEGPLDEDVGLRLVAGDPGMVTREHWATPNGDARLRDAKVYVLTSGGTGSAAEHFALAMKHTHRGVLVGSARSEEHTSELQSLMRHSYAVFCLKNNKKHQNK